MPQEPAGAAAGGTAQDLAVVVSPSAERGRSRRATDTALATLSAAGWTPTIVGAANVAALRERVSALVAGGAERVVALGGDGTVHQLLQATAGTATTIGIVPIGTGNDLAHALGLPTDPAAAARAALGPPVELDALRVGDHWVASVATAGFSAAVNDRANRLRWPRGSARYTVSTFVELPRLAPLQLQVTVDDGTPVELETVLLAVANTACFGGGMQICPGADPTDGLLDVTVVGPVGRATLLRTFPRIFSGTHVRHPAVRTYRATRLELHGPTGGAGVWGDGEPVGQFPLRIEVVPGALRVAGVAR